MNSREKALALAKKVASPSDVERGSRKLNKFFKGISAPRKQFNPKEHTGNQRIADFMKEHGHNKKMVKEYEPLLKIWRERGESKPK